MSKLDKDQVIAKFTEAYKAANGKEPQIEAKGGWYSVDGGKNMRLAALEEMAGELAGGAAPAEKPAKAEKKAEKPAKAAKKADAPAKAEKKAAAPKKKPAAKKKAKTEGFSVKAWWADQVEARNPGSRAPR